MNKDFTYKAFAWKWTHVLLDRALGQGSVKQNTRIKINSRLAALTFLQKLKVTARIFQNSSKFSKCHL